MTVADILQTAGAFRLGATGEANDGLRALIDELTGLLPTWGASAQPLMPALARILEAQERGDYTALADALEHELAPFLGG